MSIAGVTVTEVQTDLGDVPKSIHVHLWQFVLLLKFSVKNLYKTGGFENEIKVQFV